MRTPNEPDYRTMTLLEAKEFTCDQATMLQEVRHVLCLNGRELVEIVARSMGGPVGLLGYSPMFDLDGEIYTGGADETVTWYERTWSHPGNQRHAFRFFYAPNDEEQHFLIPVDGYAGFGDPDPYRRSRHSRANADGFALRWAIENRHLSPWMMVPLPSQRFSPFIFFSQDPERIRAALQSIIGHSPSAPVSAWNGPERQRTGR